MLFNVWQGKRVYLNHGFRSHSLKAWFEEAEGGGWRFIFNDTSPQIGDRDALRIKRESVGRELQERAKNAFQELTGGNLENASFAELVRVVKDAKQSRE